MERGRLLSDHRGQPSPRRAESYISARRPATPAGGRCPKYRPEALPVGFVRPVSSGRSGRNVAARRLSCRRNARRNQRLGTVPLSAGSPARRTRMAPPSESRGRKARGTAPGPAGGRVSGKRPSRSANRILRSEKMRGFRNAPRLRGAKVREHSVRARSDRRAPPPVRYRSPANALSRAISSGQRSSSGVSRMSGMSSNRASRAM